MLHWFSIKFHSIIRSRLNGHPVARMRERTDNVHDNLAQKVLAADVLLNMTVPWQYVQGEENFISSVSKKPNSPFGIPVYYVSDFWCYLFLVSDCFSCMWPVPYAMLVVSCIVIMFPIC